VNDGPRRDRVPVATPDPAIGLLVAALGALVSFTGIVAGLQVGAWIVLWIGLAVALLGLFVFFALSLVGRDYRAERNRVLREEREKERQAQAEAMIPPGNAAMAETITAIWLSRSPGMLGQSGDPDHEVALHRDGTATWLGWGFSERPGYFTGRLIEGRFVLLADLVKRSGFFGWSPLYGGDSGRPWLGPAAHPVLSHLVRDVPTTSLGAKFGQSAEVWVVTVLSEGPREFGAIIKAVDELAKEVAWTPQRSGYPLWWEGPPQEEV
jgi:hypothetical protein